MTNQSGIAGKRSFRAVLAIVIAVIVMITVFTGTAFADSTNEYKLDIIDGASEIAITTNETEPIEILTAAGITVNTDDKVDLTGFVSGEGGKIVISRYNTINISVDKKVTTHRVYAATVGEALSEIGAALGEHDKANYEMTAPVQDGMVIEVKKAFNITVKADGKKTSYAVTEGTVKDALELAGVTLEGEDYTEPALDKTLKKDMKIKVMRVTYKAETKAEAIKFSTKEVKDKKLYEGETKVKTKGVDGVKEVSYSVKYVNGKEVERKKTDEKTVKEPVQQVVRVGTKKKKSSVKSNGVKSKGGYSVGQTISGRKTHYCACAKCNGNSRGITTSGKKIRNGMKNPHYVACNWLPLGSVINVDGTNYTVVDRGGSGLSRKGRIDIFTPEGHSACYRKGTGSCKIKIVRLGW